MKVFERVTGSEAQAKPLIVGKTTVYVHEDITPVTEPDPITGEVPKVCTLTKRSSMKRMSTLSSWLIKMRFLKNRLQIFRWL